MDAYERFLERKAIKDIPTGFDAGELNQKLFPFQADIVRWALRRGRAALFCDTGLGKTAMQLEWARRVCEQSGGKVLILAPLAVAPQTVREAVKFGIPNVCYRRSQSDVTDGITVANYEMLEHFDASEFVGVVLDESSILKAYDGKTRGLIIETFAETAYKLACTATPAPNDHMELGNHSEFIGAMSRSEMLSMFFVHDGGETQKWRLKGHAQSRFWEWMCSWAAMVKSPSDLGYSDDGFILPPLRVHDVVVETESDAKDGQLFAEPAATLQERIRARRDSTSARVEKCADIVNGQDGQWIVWCNLNAESEACRKTISGAVEIRGSDSREKKEQAIVDFLAGDIRVLVSKSSIFGFGLNLQCCSNMAFVGMNDSWEGYYQAVRRCWRFGQKNPVDVYRISADMEGAVIENLNRKERDAERMSQEMTSKTNDIVRGEIRGASRDVSEYETEVATGDMWEMRLGDCVEETRSLHDDSIGYTIFSPPFASLYTYSNSDRDMGNCKTNDEFYDHFRFLITELYRVTMPGRLLSFHCMNLPTSKFHHGYIGIRDFRGEMIRAFEGAGWIYHSEVCIWKDPVTAMQRTKALGLLWKQLRKDSAMSRQGIPDYLVTMRKPGKNAAPVSHTHDEFPVEVWQRYASPVWTDINPSQTLQHRSAREEDDERHICPLQLQVIERGIDLWSAPGDSVLSPFGGIGSEGYVAVSKGRRFVGVELKRSYWQQAVANLNQADPSTKPQLGLFE